MSRGSIDPIIEVQLGSETRAVSAARQALDALADTLGIYDLNTTKLLAAELVQHALARGGGAITLRAAVTAQLVRVEVVDQSEGPDPRLQPKGVSDPTGIGLRLVHALSSRWEAREGTGHAWFELERRAPAKPAGS